MRTAARVSHKNRLRAMSLVILFAMLFTVSLLPVLDSPTHTQQGSNVTFPDEDQSFTGTDEAGYYDTEIADDKDDDQWTWNENLGDWQSHVTTGWYISLTNQSILKYVGQFRFRIEIPQGVNIISATLMCWETADQQSGYTSVIKRINETNVGPLEDDLEKPAVSNSAAAFYDGWDTVDGEWTDPIDVRNLVQEQVSLPDWQSGYYMAFEFTWATMHNYIYMFEDYQHTGNDNHAHLSITYGEVPPAKWYGDHVYRNSHVIQQTAGTESDHAVAFDVYMGSGTSFGNTAYLDWRAMAGFTDVRFTDENHSELEYYIDQYYYGETSTDYHTDVVSFYGLHERNYPSSIFYNGRTYTTYHGEGKNPMVTYYDHGSGDWGPEIEVAQTPLIDDDHGPPAMWIDNDGHIHVLYGAHNDPIPHVKSTYPERIDSWTDMGTVGTAYEGAAYSYPVVAYDAKNDVVHFWARNFESGNSTLVYRNSTDNGVSWSDEQFIVNMVSALAWPYKGAGGIDHLNPEILHMCWASYNASDTTRYYQDIRYVYVNATTGMVYNVTGHSQGYEVTSQEYDNVLAWDSRGSHVYGPAMKVPSSSSEPYFVFQATQSGGRYSAMVFWDSTTSSWKGEYKITETTTNWGGGADFIIYDKTNISAFVTSGTGDVGHWNWNGNSWSFVEWCYNTAMGRDRYLIGARVPVGQDTWNNGHHESLKLIMTEYGSNSGDHVKMFAWGTDGLVRHRPVVGARFWVKVPVDLSEVDFTMYIYYGNPSAWSIGKWFLSSSTPVPNHGTWGPTEHLTLTDTTSGYDVDTFHETLKSDYMLFPDNEAHGYYFREDGADVSDWTYTDSAPQTDGDVMSLHVMGDGNFDFFTCSDFSMPAGYYYLEYYHKADVAATSYYRVDVFEGDNAQGTSTFVDEIYCTTGWSHHKIGIRVDHAVESIRIGAKATVSDTVFQLDWVRFTNETGWQHDGSSTYGITASGSGASVASDGDYISLNNAAGGFAHFDFAIDPTETQTMLDPDLYPFLQIDFHPDDSDDWYYLLVWDADGYHEGHQSTDNWAIDAYWNIAEGGVSELKTIRISFSGVRQIRIDSLKLYFIANFTLAKNAASQYGALHVEDGALVCHNSLNNWMILEYDVNPPMNVDYNQYSMIEVRRSSANHSLYFSYLTNEWSSYDRAQLIEGPTTRNILRFRIKMSNAGRIYSIKFGNLPRGPGNAPANVQSPVCSNLDDSTYLYGRLRNYQITMYASDPDGHDNVRLMELTLVSDDKVTEYWTVRYDGVSGVFSERSDPFDYISLNTVSSTYNGAGNDSIVTFLLSINWNHPNLVDVDARCYVLDDESYSHNVYYEVDWNVETRLELPGGPTLADSSGTPNRGDVEGDILASGSVSYYGSSLHPSASEVHVYVTSPGVPNSPWRATDYEESDGSFSIVVNADSEVGQDAYRFKVVSQDEDADGTDLLDQVYSRNYIADSIDGKLSEDVSAGNETTVFVLISLTYAYDGAEITDFTVVIDKDGVDWLVTSEGSFTDARDMANPSTYTVVSASETTHGLTELLGPRSPFVPSGDGSGEGPTAAPVSPRGALVSLYRLSLTVVEGMEVLGSWVLLVKDATASTVMDLASYVTSGNPLVILTILSVFAGSVLIAYRTREYNRALASRRVLETFKSLGGLRVYTLMPIGEKRADVHIEVGGFKISCLVLEADPELIHERYEFIKSSKERHKGLLNLLSTKIGGSEAELALVGLVWDPV